jgi:glycosyltransferase involved in cell wall biosynthesis
MLLENNPYPQDARVRKEACSLRDAGYRVMVIAPRRTGQPRRELVEGIEVERFRLEDRAPSPRAFVLEYLAANAQLYVRALRRLRNVDVLHLHNPPDTLFLIGFVAKVMGVRVVFDQHDLAPELFAERFGEGPVLRVLRGLERLTYAVADAVLVVNESLRQVARERGRLADDRIFVVRNAPARSMLREVPPSRPGSLRDPRLIYVGTLGPQDGVDDLLELMRELRFRHELAGANLTIVGDGECLEPLRCKFDVAGLGEAVTFTGYVPQAEVARLLGESDICVEPARCTEHNHRCSMVKVYEYMGAGRAIVSYRLREVERLGGELISYSPCNDVRALARGAAELALDGEERLKRGEQLRQWASRWTWEVEAEQLLAAYSLAAESGRVERLRAAAPT